MGGLLSRRGLLRQSPPSLAAVRAALRRFRRFPLLAAPSALVNSAGLEVPLLLVSALYGDARAGLLGLTVRVFSGPAAILGQAVYQVFTGESSAAIREPQGTLRPAAAGRHAAPAAARCRAGRGAGRLGPAAVRAGLGPEWTEAGEYARYLALAYLAQFAVTPVSSMLFLLERQGQELAWGGTRLLLTAGGVAVCGFSGAPIGMAIGTLAVGQVISYALLFVLCLRAADHADRQFRRSA